MRTCKRCGQSFEGRKCKPCAAASQRRYRGANPDKVRASQAASVAKRSEHYRTYHKAYTSTEDHLAWRRARHRERLKTDRDYRAKHKADIARTQVERRLGMFAGLARHFREQTKAFYAACPDGLTVDHIHPLLGETFCGLHVPWNLQYLTLAENIRKGGR